MIAIENTVFGLECVDKVGDGVLKLEGEREFLLPK